MTRVEHAIDVNVPVRKVYDQLLHFEQYPRFMEGVDRVTRIDATHLRWHSRHDGRESEWDVELTDQIPDRSIAWRCTSGPCYEASVQLQGIEDDRTRVTLTIEPKLQQGPGHGHLPHALSQRTEQDLARFKKFVEGLVPDTGDWRGRLSHEALQQEQGTPAQAHGLDQAGEGSTRSATSVAASAVGAAADAFRGSAGMDQSAPAASGSSGQRHPQADQRLGRDRRRGSLPFGARLPRLPNLLQGWDDPLGMVKKVSEEMDQLAQKVIGRGLPGSGGRAHGSGTSGWTPTVEVAQRPDRIVICAELPGVRREDVQIEVRNDRLTIEGDRHPESPQAAQEYRRSERSYGHFYRVIALPEGADKDGAEASMHDGVLEITVPLSQQARQSRRVEIRDSH